MKNLILLPAFFSAIILASCSKSDSTDSSTDLSVKKGDVSTGSWKVTQYLDSGKDETNNYSSYSFDFNTDGTVFASNGTTDFSGTWNLISGSNSSTSSSSDDISSRLTITITGNKQMEDISKKWLVLKITETEISLSDDNVASNEHLKFGR